VPFFGDPQFPVQQRKALLTYRKKRPAKPPDIRAFFATVSLHTSTLHPSLMGRRCGVEEYSGTEPKGRGGRNESTELRCGGKAPFGELRPISSEGGQTSQHKRFWGHPLESDWDEFISIPEGVIGMATTCEDKSRAVPRNHSEWSVVIGSRRMARSAGT
jgi:hypothetical protein